MEHLRRAERSNAFVSIRRLCASAAVACGVAWPSARRGEPRVRLLAHRTPQLAEGDISWWVAREKIDVARGLRRVAGWLGNTGGKHDVAVRVVDREHTLRTDNPDLQAVH